MAILDKKHKIFSRKNSTNKKDRSLYEKVSSCGTLDTTEYHYTGAVWFIIQRPIIA